VDTKKSIYIIKSKRKTCSFVFSATFIRQLIIVGFKSPADAKVVGVERGQSGDHNP